MHSPVVPDRQKDLLKLVVGLYEQCENKSKGIPRGVVVSKAAELPCAEQYWNFWMDSSSVIHSEEVDDDLNGLHARGYLYATVNPHIFPTARTNSVIDVR